MRMMTMAAIAAAVLVGGAAHAGEIKGKQTFYWTYTSTTLAEGDTAGYNTGRAFGPQVEADGVIASVDCLGWSAADGRSGGQCVNYSSHEDNYWIDYQCDTVLETPPAGALFACDGTAKAVGGTGKYAAIKGTNTHTLVLTGILPDGTLVGYTLVEANYTY